MEESNNGDPKFQWGIKRGVGGAKKDVQFYGSFTLDEMSYALTDCVYLYGERETEPYVGKILKIWEQSPHKKKVKILWFFRSNEIHNYLGDYKPTEKELFMASGEGVGLANINPLEAITGKCSVICTSKDERNLQPSKDALEKADFIFYRTFDVGTFTLSDKLPEKIATFDIKSLLNREEDLVTGSFPTQANCCVRNEKAEVGTAAHLLPNLDTKRAKIVEPVQVPLSIPSKDKVTEKQQPNEAKHLKTEFSQDVGEANDYGGQQGDEKQLKQTGSFPTQANCCVTNEKAEVGTAAHLLPNLDTKRAKIVEPVQVPLSIPSKDKVTEKQQPNEAKHLKTEFSQDVGEANDYGGQQGDEKVASVKSKAQSDLSNDKLSTKLKSSDASVKSEDLPKDGHINRPDGHRSDEKVTSVKSKTQSDLSNDRPSKKLKSNDASVKSEDLSKDKHTTVAKNALTKHNKDDAGKRSIQLHKEDSAKMKTSEKKVRSSEEPWQKAPPSVSVKDNAKAEHQMLEVTRRPDADRSKWFKALSWEDRIQKAHEQGTLMFLQNFDPSLTSATIEDIIYHTFKQSCTAKVIPLIPPYHNPHYGKAYVIFKTQDAANEAIERINTGCLMLPNGSPLMASKGMLKIPPKATMLTGHFFISKVKNMLREEMRKAVSTSHCSQPNTIAYEMALNWILMQEKALSSFNKLYKRHDDDAKEVKKNLKTKQ